MFINESTNKNSLRSSSPQSNSMERKISLSALMISNLLQSKLVINYYYTTTYIILSLHSKQYFLENEHTYLKYENFFKKCTSNTKNIIFFESTIKKIKRK